MWLVHVKFICGITGVVRDDHGRVLLLRHRLWPHDRQWGFPTGCACKGERHEGTIAREVREETGLTVKAGRLLKVRSGFRYRIEVYYEAVLVGGLDGLTLDPKEVLEGRLFSPADLPDGMPEAHRELADSLGSSKPAASAPKVLGACHAARVVPLNPARGRLTTVTTPRHRWTFTLNRSSTNAMCSWGVSSQGNRSLAALHFLPSGVE
jgi:ADP-ribose pyrophosphatase YjhB (NUDIX family)